MFAMEGEMEILNQLKAYNLYYIMGLLVLVIILTVLYFITLSHMRKLEKRYSIFMEGKDAKNLEQILTKRLNQVDELLESNSVNKADIQVIYKKLESNYQKSGLVKYDAFNEMGGKLSFSICLLNEKNDGFIVNAVHSTDGCYTYVKEVVKGNAYIVLSPEEKEALKLALENLDPQFKEEKKHA